MNHFQANAMLPMLIASLPALLCGCSLEAAMSTCAQCG